MSQPLSSQSFGQAQGPCLVLLHSIATHGGMWQAQIQMLAPHFRIVTIDLPGHGASPPLAEPMPSMEIYARCVLATLDELGVERFALAGLSLGSMIAQQVAAITPERVWGLILSNGVAHVPEPVKEAWRDRVQTAQSQGMESQVDGTIERWFTPEFRAAQPDVIQEISAMIKGTDIAGYMAAAHAIMTMDNRPALQTITAPSLVLAGAKDLAAPAAGVKIIADNIKGASFATLDGSHLMNIELSDDYTNVIGQFLTQCVEQMEGV